MGRRAVAVRHPHERAVADGRDRDDPGGVRRVRTSVPSEGCRGTRAAAEMGFGRPQRHRPDRPRPCAARGPTTSAVSCSRSTARSWPCGSTRARWTCNDEPPGPSTTSKRRCTPRRSPSTSPSSDPSDRSLDEAGDGDDDRSVVAPAAGVRRRPSAKAASASRRHTRRTASCCPGLVGATSRNTSRSSCTSVRPISRGSPASIGAATGSAASSSHSSCARASISSTADAGRPRG